MIRDVTLFIVNRCCQYDLLKLIQILCFVIALSFNVNYSVIYKITGEICNSFDQKLISFCLKLRKVSILHWFKAHLVKAEWVYAISCRPASVKFQISNFLWNHWTKLNNLDRWSFICILFLATQPNMKDGLLLKLYIAWMASFSFFNGIDWKLGNW